MPDFRVQASTDIATSIQQVHDALVDFTTWPMWSPWLYIEPDAQLSYSGTKGELGHAYQWTGDKVGAGSMSLTGVAPGRIDYTLQFQKPFKSTAAVWFDLKESSPHQASLTWSMDSKLPFFMFWMMGSMTSMIRADYDRGLALLKDLLETGSVQSRTKLLDVTELDALAYVGLKNVTPHDQLPMSISKTFSALSDKVESELFNPVGNAFCLYHRIDIKQGEIEYTGALPVAEPESVDMPFLSSIRPACRALYAVHTGPYRHLPNAWEMLKSEAKSKKLKVSKIHPPIEHYLNDVDKTEASDLITELYLPLK
ncbi:MAG: GyrI-like domain-containing protein [Granulosicoccus sp.]